MTRIARTSCTSSTRSHPFFSILRCTDASDLGRPYISSNATPASASDAPKRSMAASIAARCSSASSAALSRACASGCVFAKHASSSRALRLQTPRRDASGTCVAAVSSASSTDASSRRTRARRDASSIVTARASVAARSIARSRARSSSEIGRTLARLTSDTSASLHASRTSLATSTPTRRSASSGAKVEYRPSKESFVIAAATTSSRMPNSATSSAVSAHRARRDGSPRCAAAATRNALTTRGVANAACLALNAANAAASSGSSASSGRRVRTSRSSSSAFDRRPTLEASFAPRGGDDDKAVSRSRESADTPRVNPPGEGGGVLRCVAFRAASSRVVVEVAMADMPRADGETREPSRVVSAADDAARSNPVTTAGPGPGASAGEGRGRSALLRR